MLGLEDYFVAWGIGVQVPGLDILHAPITHIQGTNMCPPNRSSDLRDLEHVLPLCYNSQQ